MITVGAQGRASGAGGEDMEDREEMETESTSNVTMLAAGGTFTDCGHGRHYGY